MSAQNIKLNMIPSGIVPVFHISQYDKGRELSASVYFGVLPFNLDNYTVTIEATRNDGVAIITAVETSNNNGTFEVTPTMSNVVGKYYAQLVIVNSNSKRIASLPFAINVIKAAMDENAEAIEEDATLYQQYTDAMQSTVAEVKEDLENEVTAREVLQNSLEIEIFNRQGADNVLNARINSIIAPSGEAPNAAEILDARVGVDGNVYASLGTAIRTQVGNIQDLLNNYVLVATRNLFVGVFKPYSNIDNNTGVYAEGSSYPNTVATEFYIPVESGKTYILSENGNPIVEGTYGTPYIFVYDAQKTFLRRIDAASFTSISGDAYVRVKLRKTSATETLASYTKWQFENSNTVTEYISPYYLDGSKLADGFVSTQKIQDSAVTEEKTVFFDRTKNLFVGAFKPYSNIDNDTGIYITGSSYPNTVATEFYIPIEEEKAYIFSENEEMIGNIGTPYIFVYDSQKTFLRRIDAASFTSISGDAYVRLKVKKDGETETLASYTKWQFENSNTITNYIPPFLLKSKYEYVEDGTITEEKTVFFDRTRNLFIGEFKPYTNLDTTTGLFKEGSSYPNTVATEFYIPVESGETYVFSKDGEQISSVGTPDIYVYDSQKAFLRRIALDSFTAISGDAYVRLRVKKDGETEVLASYTNWQFEKGSDITEYIAPFILKPKYLDDKTDIGLTYKTTSLSDANLKNTYTRNAFIANLYSNAPRNTPSVLAGELMNGTQAVLSRHEVSVNPNIIRFALITDCHVGGKRAATFDPTYNINAFISLANEMADFAVNAGDMITNYYDATYMNSLQMAKDTEEEAHDMFSGLTVPYYIAKGNHDIGINGFSVVEAPESYTDGYFGIDPNNGAIYRITEENFADYKASGLDFYQLTGHTYFTNQEIQEVCLNGYCPNAVFNSSDPYGWYYYFDVNSQLRVIVLNDFYNVNDAGGTGDTSRSPYEAAWLETVLASAVSSNLAVVTISHTAKGLTAIRPLIAAFTRNGGVYIGHIHGHEHSDVYALTGGYNNIGVDASLIAKGSVCTVDGFSFDMFEIDLSNNILYETRTGRFNDHGNDAHGDKLYRSEDRLYSFVDNGLLI